MSGNREYLDSFPIPKSLGFPESSYESLAHAISLVNGYMESQHGGIRIGNQNWPIDWQDPGAFFSNIAYARQTTYTPMHHPMWWDDPQPGVAYTHINAVAIMTSGQSDVALQARLQVWDSGNILNIDSSERSVFSSTATAIQQGSSVGIVENAGYHFDLHVIAVSLPMNLSRGAATKRILVSGRALARPFTTALLAPWRPVWLEVFASREF